MTIVEEENSGLDTSVLNISRIRQLIYLYKFPLILAAIGLAFLLVGIVYIVKTQQTSSEVIFSSADSTSSAKPGKEKIHVDVEGAVMAPGVYEIEEGSRINSVLSKAGGLSAEADREWMTKNLNLAAKLVDGGKIYIPSIAETSDGKVPFGAPQGKQNLGNLSNTSNLLGVTTGRVNINSASQAEIEELPGVGPVTAVKIISNRPYQSVDELKNRKVVGNALFTKIKDLITI